MKDILNKMHKTFGKMCNTGQLFESNLSGNDLWEIYINGFEPKDLIFRDPESSVHNCNMCKSFFRRYGNVMALDKNLNLITLFEKSNEEYAAPFAKMARALKNAGIKNVFVETIKNLNSLPYEKNVSKSADLFQLGFKSNRKIYTQEEVAKFGVVEPDRVYTFNHFHVFVPNKFIFKRTDSVEKIQGKFRDDFNTFKRALEEIPLDTLELVRDLFTQGSFFNYESYEPHLREMIKMKRAYEKQLNKEAWIFKTFRSLKYPRFRNSLLGTLCVELAEGKDINKAQKDWNYRIDPVNFMKAVAPLSERQKQEAQQFIVENGYEPSFDRRFATTEDIKISEILHINDEGGDQKQNVSIFDNVKTPSTRHKRSQFDGLQEVSIEKFMEEILPNTTKLELLVENKFTKNFVTMTTANDPNSKRIFKWDNNYSWTYSNNLAGKSQISERVKSLGGNIDALFRFSIAWSDNDGDESDLDAWAKEPGETGNEIGFSTLFRKDRSNEKTPNSGQLDVDIIHPPKDKMAVENIAWSDINKLENGVYILWVNPYNINNSKGFKAEIKIDKETFKYEYNQPVRKNVTVAKVTVENGSFSIKHVLKPVNETRKVYGIKTNEFHKVKLACVSPNYWGENSVGNKHYFFMLENAKADKPLRTFHNENLKSELLKYRKIMDVVGEVNKVESDKAQLSGLGFNATVKNSVIAKVSGTHKRMIKINF